MGVGSLPARGRTGHLVAAKVEIPPPPARLVERPHVAHHASWSGGDVTAVIAGPGHGKTVAARQHVRGQIDTGVPVAWLSLDQYDDHPSRFWPHLVGALRRPFPTIGAQTRAVAAHAGPGADDDLGPVEALVRELGALARPAILVLDDLHHLRDRTLVEQLGHLVEHRPPRLRIVMTMRTEAPLPFTRWRRAGRLHELRAADLRFTTADGVAFLRRFPDLALDDGQRADLVAKLDGWPAMVSLTAHALRRRPDASAFVARRLASDRLVMDYLVGDIVDRLTADDRRFLFALSVLDRFDIELATELTGDPHAGVRLRTLERDGLFVSALDPARTTFRFHRLVAELVHHELRWRGDDALIDAHRHAAEVLDRRGCVEEAMIHLLQAGDPVAALHPRQRRDGDEDEDGAGDDAWPPRAVRSPLPAGAVLSEREAALLALLPTHLNYREMAAELYVSVNTVKTQIKSVYRKLGATSRAEAVRSARQRGLLT